MKKLLSYYISDFIELVNNGKFGPAIDLLLELPEKLVHSYNSEEKSNLILSLIFKFNLSCRHNTVIFIKTPKR